MGRITIRWQTQTLRVLTKNRKVSNVRRKGSPLFSTYWARQRVRMTLMSNRLLGHSEGSRRPAPRWYAGRIGIKSQHWSNRA